MRKRDAAEETAGGKLRSPDPNQASEAGRALGSIRTEKKATAARANLLKATTRGKPPTKDPLTLPCACGAGTATEIGTGHKTTCPRGRLLYQRAKIAAKQQKAGSE